MSPDSFFFKIRFSKLCNNKDFKDFLEITFIHTEFAVGAGVIIRIGLRHGCWH
ncbi:15639_t:CDS:2 [Gigaspora rosea]|nr:15639_t:CDS:2 [Gigaspora rosea]